MPVKNTTIILLGLLEKREGKKINQQTDENNGKKCADLNSRFGLLDFNFKKKGRIYTNLIVFLGWKSGFKRTTITVRITALLYKFESE